SVSVTSDVVSGADDFRTDCRIMLERKRRDIECCLHPMLVQDSHEAPYADPTAVLPLRLGLEIPCPGRTGRWEIRSGFMSRIAEQRRTLGTLLVVYDYRNCNACSLWPLHAR